jgi:lysozyme
MVINSKGKELIKKFEGLKLSTYRDIVGVFTIGYGHTGKDVYVGRRLTEQEADTILDEDLQKFQEGVSQLVKVPLTENQFSALVCFAFNLGLKALGKSTLLSKLNDGDISGASAEIMKWNKAGGVPVQGLTNRRAAEKALFEDKS